MNKHDDLLEIKRLRESGLTHRQIAEKIGSSKTRVGDICLKYGFNKSVLEPTFNQMSVLVGTVIGDGGVYKSTLGSEARMSLSHCLEQEGYLRYKYSIISDLIGSELTYKSQFDKRTGKTYKSIKMQSRVNRIYTKLRNDWYGPDGKKIINPVELNKYGEMVLAIKYFDDGCINGKGNYSIAMNDYSLECIKHFQDWLLSKFGIVSTMHKTRVVYIPKAYRAIVSKILIKFMTDDVAYKVNQSDICRFVGIEGE